MLLGSTMNQIFKGISMLSYFKNSLLDTIWVDFSVKLHVTYYILYLYGKEANPLAGKAITVCGVSCSTWKEVVFRFLELIEEVTYSHTTKDQQAQMMFSTVLRDRGKELKILKSYS